MKINPFPPYSSLGSNMSSLPPLDVIIDILSRLPFKSLLRFKDVCKTWHSLISHDPYFQSMMRRVVITPYKKHPPPPGLPTIAHGAELPIIINSSRSASLVWNEYGTCFDFRKMPRELSFLFRRCRPRVDTMTTGPCNGVFLLHNSQGCIALWNHATRDYRVLSREINIPIGMLDVLFGEVVSQGEVTDLMVLWLYANEVDSPTKRLPQLFRLSTGKWKVLEPNLPLEYISTHICSYCYVCINGIFYWLMCDGNSSYIVCFNPKSETFLLINDIPAMVKNWRGGWLPKLACFTSEGHKFLSIVLYFFIPKSFDLWVMKEWSGGMSCWVKEESINYDMIFENFERKEVDELHKRDPWFNALLYEESLAQLRG